MKKWGIILGIIVIIAIIGFFILPKIIEKIRGGPSCSAPPDEWIPRKGECPGTTTEMQAKCDEFCDKYPDCCGERKQGGERGGRNIIPLPDEKAIEKLARSYPTIIKATNEGPAIYGQGKYELISNETFEKIKDTGFNTIQLLTINDCTGDKCVMDGDSKSILLNDIVRAKQNGLAVWVAVEYINAPPGSNKTLPEYSKFKNSFIDYCKEIGELAEEYKVEYLTLNNEPDVFLQEQTWWGSEEQINKYIIELMPLANSAAKEKFTGKIINKVTQPKKRSKEVLDASFKNVDIASIDVGPPVEDNFMGFDYYELEFGDYQYYATKASAAGVPWMNGEYWQYDYFGTPSSIGKDNQLKLAEISFDAYLAATPAGVGYTWNDFSTFSQPQGEQTRLAIKEFFDKI